MKHFATLFILCTIGFAARAQFTYKIKADSVKITNDSCSAELILENSTKNVKGILYNKGNGRTEFRPGPRMSHDTLFCGSDTFNVGSNFWKLTGNTGTNSSNFIGTINNNALVFKTNNIERMRIKENNGSSDGYLGLGTSNPSTMFHLYGVNPVLTIEGDSLSYYPGIRIKSHIPSGYIDSYGISSAYLGGLHIYSFTALNRTVGMGASYYGNISVSNDSTLITHRVIGAQRQANDIFDVSGNTATNYNLVSPEPYFVVKNNGRIVFNKYPNNVSEDSVLTTDVNGKLKLRSLGSGISSSAWTLTGNSGTNPTNNFLGTIDSTDLIIRTKNIERSRWTADGKLLVGTATDYLLGTTTDAAAKFKVEGTSRFTNTMKIYVPDRDGNEAWTYTHTPAVPGLRLGTTDIDITSINTPLISFGRHIGPGLMLYDNLNDSASCAGIGIVPYGFMNYIGGGSSTTYFTWNTGGYHAVLGVGELMRLKNNGNLMLGTTTDNGFRLSVAGTAQISNPATGLTADSKIVNVNAQGSTFNTTSSVLTSYSGYFNSNGTRTSGSNALTNIGLYTTASGAQTNIALKTDGNVNMANLPTTTDTTSYKPLAVNSSGDVAKVTGWPPAVNYTVQSLTDASTITWNAANGINAEVTLTSTGRTLSITNPVAGMTYTIRIIQGSGGSKTITTWPTNSKWPSGTTPTLSTVAARYDIVVFYYDGTNFYGTYQQNFQ